ncbi:recombinase family protein [Photobacterium rosenbergii]|uniref:recombinase family protein n=1 Tax=Photobacterium rosenbergii TaxID=294936 RepID=UPI001C99C45C|nr:recombinase family protein [Photobacterium rosenbergii]MBY5945560.1 recombinase family protein [Photobacterium rosenbergii]
MAKYIYSRFSPRNTDYQQQIDALNHSEPSAEQVQDRVRGDVDPMARQGFHQLYDKLKEGDVVWVWWLTAFSHDFNMVQATVASLLDKGVTLKTLSEPLTFVPDSESSLVLLSLLSGYGNVQTRKRLLAAEHSRKAMKENPELWQQKFRGRPADREKHRQIATMLLEGHKLQHVADSCGVSISTVKRVKSKISQFDDEGALRTRHTCKRHKDNKPS